MAKLVDAHIWWLNKIYRIHHVLAGMNKQKASERSVIIYRAYMLIEDTGSYQRFFRSDWFVSKELVELFISKIRTKWEKESDYEIEIKEMYIQEQVESIGNIDSYMAYHEFDSE